MPIRPQPCTYSCKQCNWKKTVAPSSDALLPGEHFGACPVCASTSIERRAPTMLELALINLFSSRRTRTSGSSGCCCELGR